MPTQILVGTVHALLFFFFSRLLGQARPKREGGEKEWVEWGWLMGVGQRYSPGGESNFFMGEFFFFIYRFKGNSLI